MPKPDRTTKKKNTLVGSLNDRSNAVSSKLNILLLTTYHAAVFLSQMLLQFRNKISGVSPDESISYMN